MVRFKKINLEEDVQYTATIVSWSVDDDKRFFRLLVEIAGIDGMQFMKCIRYSEYSPSALSIFCENFDIIERKGYVDFDRLLDLDVVVTLNRGKDGNFYISEIYPKIYEEEDDVQDEEIGE